MGASPRVPRNDGTEPITWTDVASDGSPETLACTDQEAALESALFVVYAPAT